MSENPWEAVELATYESHMGSEGVAQLQALSRITQEQLSYKKERVAILGSAGGNGLEHIDLSVTKKIYAIDINDSFLHKCRERYAKLGDALETIKCDLREAGVSLPQSGLLICNLIIEYLGVAAFLELIKCNIEKLEIISCVIQKNNGGGFVSASPAAKELMPLNSVHQDITLDELAARLPEAGMREIKRSAYQLPNGKEFIRIDFIRSEY